MEVITLILVISVIGFIYTGFKIYDNYKNGRENILCKAGIIILGVAVIVCMGACILP